MQNTGNFKSCSCGQTWAMREDFIRDPDTEPIGIMSAESESPALFFFNHSGCESTLAIDVREFADLIEEPIPATLLTGTDECPGRCVTIEDLEACELECHNAPFRRFLLNRIMTKDI